MLWLLPSRSHRRVHGIIWIWRQSRRCWRMRLSLGVGFQTLVYHGHCNLVKLSLMLICVIIQIDLYFWPCDQMVKPATEQSMWCGKNVCSTHPTKKQRPHFIVTRFHRCCSGLPRILSKANSMSLKFFSWCGGFSKNLMYLGSFHKNWPFNHFLWLSVHHSLRFWAPNPSAAPLVPWKRPILEWKSVKLWLVCPENIM